jgi:hypothetical protein
MRTTPLKPTSLSLTPASELARRTRLAPATLRRRLQAMKIQPAALMIAGSRPPIALFDLRVVEALVP